MTPTTASGSAEHTPASYTEPAAAPAASPLIPVTAPDCAQPAPAPTAQAVRKLWAEVFGDSDEYLDMYFGRVYREDDLLAITSGQRLESALLLQPYKMQFQGAELPVSYLCGAMTRRQSRGKGMMGALVLRALRLAHERGRMMVALIPASDWLYPFYYRLGFARVFFVDVQRFTALHTFAPQGAYHAVESPYDPAVVEAFEQLERNRDCTILHSRRDFLNILDDNSLDGGSFVAVAADGDDTVAAMAWAVPDASAGLLTVTELLGRNHDAREAALAELRRLHPGLAFKVLAPPLSEGRRLEPFGMGRVTNCLAALRAMAAAHPSLKLKIRVTDALVPDNSGLFILPGRGTVEAFPADTPIEASTLNYDVDAEVFTSLIFSSPRIGEVLGLPTHRAVMRLMLQ